MRKLAILTILSLLATTGLTRAADDFLKPDNWEGLPEFWKIDGDTVVGSAAKDPGFNTFFCSKKKYKDFELTAQVKLKDGKGNSGFQIRSTVVDMKKFVVAGPQADVGANYWGSLYGERFDGKGKIGGGHMMKASDPKKINEKLKSDGFNEYKIICKGKHVTITVNGVVGVDQAFDILPEEGIIAFQLHAGGPMEATFKGIVFKELK